MSILSNLVGGGLVNVAKGVGDVIDQFVETDDEKRAAEILKAKIAAAPHLAQIDVNKIEASHRTVFVAGWRPFVGWVCGFSLAYNFILRDLLAWVILNTGATASMPPDIAMDGLITILCGLLGLGAMRTVEKIKGKSK